MIVFAILAHNDDHVLREQIKNVRYYNPGCMVVLFNGGRKKSFGRKLGIPICPYSRPLTYGNLAPFLFLTMKWLEEMKVGYDYLVNLDSDMIFINSGFDYFLETKMEGYDVMGGHMSVLHSPEDMPGLQPTDDMWREWSIWQPFFNIHCFVRYINPGQVYTKRIAQKILDYTTIQTLEDLWKTTKVHAIEEMIWPTIALSLGGKCRDYQSTFSHHLEEIRWRPYFSLKEIASRKPFGFFWVHPVSKETLMEYTRRYMT